MLKNYLNANLSESGVQEKYFLFFQVWKELTEARTFDSYQFKSFNIINGLEELIHNIDNYLSQNVPTTHSIEAVNQELTKAVGTDYVLTSKFPSLKNQLLTNLQKKRETPSSYKALRHELNFYLCELMPKYDRELINCLIDCVEQIKHKETIKLTSIFISRCVDTGWSIRALHHKLDLYDGKDLELFLNKIYGCTENNYSILFPFRLTITPPSGKTREDSKTYVVEQLKKYNINVLEKGKIKDMFLGINESMLKNDEYMVVSVLSKDIYGASHSAIVSLSNALNILSFFSVIDPWTISNRTWIAYNTDSPYTKTLNPKDVYTTYEYLDSSSMVYSRVEKIINECSLENNLIQKLSSSFSYANLSHASTSVEEKYMNMWIALESLLRVDSYDSIISNILDCVPCANCLRFVYKEIRNFAEDCGRCGVSLDFEDVHINIQDFNKEILVSQLLSIFRGDNYSELATRCQVSDLLKHRCDEIFACVNNDQNFIFHIKSHYQTVRWHLDRLYRIRNEIAHSAVAQQMSIIRYTEHLYDYLSTYISEAIRFAAEKNIMNWEEITVAINNNYAEFLYIANEKAIKDKKMFLQKLWVSGIMDYI